MAEPTEAELKACAAQAAAEIKALKKAGIDPDSLSTMPVGSLAKVDQMLAANPEYAAARDACNREVAKRIKVEEAEYDAEYPDGGPGGSYRGKVGGGPGDSGPNR